MLHAVPENKPTYTNTVSLKAAMGTPSSFADVGSAIKKVTDTRASVTKIKLKTKTKIMESM